MGMLQQTQTELMHRSDNVTPIKVNDVVEALEKKMEVQENLKNLKDKIKKKKEFDKINKDTIQERLK